MRQKYPMVAGRKKNIDRRGRNVDHLEPEEEAGCQIYRKKLLCGKRQFVVMGTADRRVGICIECWNRVMAIAADAHIDTLETRRRYEKMANNPDDSGRDGSARPQLHRVDKKHGISRSKKPKKHHHHHEGRQGAEGR